MNNQTLLATIILAIAAGMVLVLVLVAFQRSDDNGSTATLRLGDGDYTETEFRELLQGYFGDPDFAAFWCEGTLGDLSLPSIADTFGLFETGEYREDAERARAIIGEECDAVRR